MRKTLAAIATTVAASSLALLPAVATAADHQQAYAYAYGQAVATATATCPLDYYASGGSASANGGYLTYEEPTADGRGWTAYAQAHEGAIVPTQGETAVSKDRAAVSEGETGVFVNVTAVCVHE